MSNKYGIDTTHMLSRKPGLERYEGSFELPQPKQCNTCSKIHTTSELVAVLDPVKKHIWFQCPCGSTLLISLKKTQQKRAA